MAHEVEQRSDDGERGSTVDETESLSGDEDVDAGGLESRDDGETEVGDESRKHLGDDSGFGFVPRVFERGVRDSWSDGGGEGFGRVGHGGGSVERRKGSWVGRRRSDRLSSVGFDLVERSFQLPVARG